VQSKQLNFSVTMVAFNAFVSVTTLACGELGDDADHADVGPVAPLQQDSIILGCNPATINADASFSTAPANCQVNSARSLNDIYAEIFCAPYVVEYTYRPLHFGAAWDHLPWSQAECEALRTNISAYTFNNGTWTTNGTATLHGVWCDPNVNDFCPEQCAAEFDSGNVLPTLGTGTKWRVAASAYATNCGGSSCYRDYKRVVVSDAANCSIP
jgi:hypothetical protein